MTITVDRASVTEFEAAEGDYGFDVDAYYAPEVDRPVNEWRATPVARYRKNYRPWSAIEDADEVEGAALFVARRAGKAIGRITVKPNWNNYGLVDNVAVDAGARGSGAARLLMDACAAWAKTEGLAGLSLETQNNNLAACRFYERYGFVLGGFDRFFYRGETPGTREVALFWYLLFEREAVLDKAQR